MKSYLVVFFISMLPIVELRGSIPYSQALGLPILTSYVVAILGNLLPIPFIYFFGRNFLLWGQKQKYIGKLFDLILKKGEKAGDKLSKKAGKSGVFLAIMLFVGIPIPGTGVYTGVLASSILDIDFKTTVIAACFGVLLAGFIMAFVSFNIANMF